jgi:hypothetical protein
MRFLSFVCMTAFAFLYAVDESKAQQMQFSCDQSVTIHEVAGTLHPATAEKVTSVFRDISSTTPVGLSWNVMWNADGTATLSGPTQVEKEVGIEFSAGGEWKVASFEVSAGSKGVTKFSVECTQNANGTATVVVRWTIPIYTASGIVNMSGTSIIGMVSKGELGTLQTPQSYNDPNNPITAPGAPPPGSASPTQSTFTLGWSSFGSASGNWQTTTYTYETWDADPTCQGACTLTVHTVTVETFVKNTVNEVNDHEIA